MRILHISDLHLRETYKIEDEVNKILERFFCIISKNADDQPFDYVVLTGDIRNTTDGISVRSASELLLRICNSAKLRSRKQLHILPGNHDLERINQDIVKQAIDHYDYDNGVLDNTSEVLKRLNDRFNLFFFQLCNEFHGDDNYWINRNSNPHYLIQTDTTALIFLNSALTCQENAKDGRLILCRVYVRELLKLIDTEITKQILVFAHHPIKELQNQEKTSITNLLRTYSNDGASVKWFCGDAHSNVSGDVDGIDYYQVGSLCLTQKDKMVVIPDFVIYDFSDNRINRRVFRFLPHLNSTSELSGGWKRVYYEPVDMS